MHHQADASASDQTNLLQDPASATGSQDEKVEMQQPAGASSTDQTNLLHDPASATGSQDKRVEMQQPAGASATDQPSQIRDPASPTGSRDALQVYDQFVTRHFPDFKTHVYRVPPVHVGPRQSEDSGDSGDEYKIYRVNPSDEKGDEAERQTADCIERFLKKERAKAFILTSYHFRNFCHKAGPPVEDTNEYTSPWGKEGEHDIVIIDYERGVLFIQVKAYADKKDKRGASQSVKTAFNQLRRDKDFFEANFKDLTQDMTKSFAVSLPNFCRENLNDEGFPETRKEFNSGFHNLMHSRSPNDDYLHLGLFFEDLDDETMMKTWWNYISEKCQGFSSWDDYKRVVGRYIGFRSTVETPFGEGLTRGQCVSLIDNKYTNIVLTPHQITVLNTTEAKLIIRGEYGAGKTVLLVLKVRQLLRSGRTVSVVSMAKSDLLNVLQFQIKQGLSQDEQNIEFKQIDSTADLAKHLRRNGGNKDVFIDEFPSHLLEDIELKDAITQYQNTLWIIMSRERQDGMSRGVKDTLAGALQEVVLRKVLRCPPSITTFLPNGKRERKEIEYSDKNSGSLKMMIQRHFKTIGFVFTQDTVENSQSCLNISDIVVVDAIKREWLVKLIGLDVPIVHDSSVTKDQVAKIKSGQLKKALYSHNKEGDGMRKVAETEEGVVFYYKDTKQVTDIKKLKGKKDLALLLHSLGAKSHAINKALKSEHNSTEPDEHFHWYDITVVDEQDKPEFVSEALRELHFPLVTPAEPDKCISEDAVLFTNPENFEGYVRKKVIRVERGRLLIDDDELASADGPECQYVKHITNHGCVLERCNTCRESLLKHLGDLGLHRNQVAAQESEGPEAATPTVRDLDWSDVVVLDNRSDGNISEIQNHFAFPRSVIFKEPNSFLGLERKVVIVLNSNKKPSPLTSDGCIVDHFEAAITRCSSQLIIIEIH
ncbi:uncharacterized protein LOC124124083 isoform X2 [Haliotis rufescens]|uniref:uncharacterized protein LOC124124083 isoform X2 n=1 Tax=Haliotis rufescens TaxID=6454 RepID=UPI00201F1411|nr:uncharacterized protein LOC124124083 isoform X2 [Haliotis rufescens]XP_048256275.1 uncharacterized protein LOC124124083 isoform X2 [Haliotis rufescens]